MKNKRKNSSFLPCKTVEGERIRKNEKKAEAQWRGGTVEIRAHSFSPFAESFGRGRGRRRDSIYARRRQGSPVQSAISKRSM